MIQNLKCKIKTTPMKKKPRFSKSSRCLTQKRASTRDKKLEMKK